MNELPLNIQRAVTNYKDIETDGLILRPILVREYDSFLIAKPAIEVMHQSLPVRFLRMPLLAALYQMDFEAAIAGEQQTGLFSRTLLFLALSMRLGADESIDARLKRFQIVTERQSPEKLISLRFVDNDGASKDIKPALYQKLRPILAAQNGIELENEKANPDLVKAKRDMSASGRLNLDINIEDLKTAVAVASRVEEEDIDEWAILKLNRRAETIQRYLAYIVCGIGEMSGTSWKGGNPYPHPFFKKMDSLFGFATPMADSDVNQKPGLKGVNAIESQIKQHSR